jgi:hypothetical protein
VALSHKVLCMPRDAGAASTKRNGVGAEKRAGSRHTRRVPASAPRYDQRLLAALRILDDESQAIAETCRKLGEEASRLGLPRPSYVHVRRLVKAERERRAELTAVSHDLVRELAAGQAPRLEAAVGRRREANRRADLKRRS